MTKELEISYNSLKWLTEQLELSSYYMLDIREAPFEGME